MQQVIYVCDHCKTALREERHFSLQFGRFSGVANPSPNGKWGISPSLEGKFIHLHRSCVLKYFSALITKKGKK